MKNCFKRLFGLGAAVLMCSSYLPNIPAAAPSGGVEKMKVCSFTEPLGIDENPVFSWTVDLPGRFDVSQTAYRVKVSSTKQKADAGTADVWDSGEIESDNMTSVAYAGAPLASKTAYYWTVESVVGDESLKSEVSRFSTGMLTPGDWKGEWIGKPAISEKADLSGAEWIWSSAAANPSDIKAGELYFRKKFEIPAGRTVSRAILGFTADDQASVYLNGSERSSVTLWSSGKTVDVTGVITPGENIIAFKAKNDTEGYAGLIAKLAITFDDGTKQTISTDSSWKTSEKISDGWNKMQYDDSAWENPNRADAYGSAPWGTGVTLAADGERAAVMLRKEFRADKPVKQAFAYVCGLGFFDFTLNGEHPDDSVLNPFTTQYEKTVLYRTFDVTDMIKTGDNAIGVELGNSFYNETVQVWLWHIAKWRDNPKLRLNLEIEYEDGTSETVYTDTDWKLTTDGPTCDNSMYYGETYDARKEQTGFSQPGFDDSEWEQSRIMKAPLGEVKAQMKAPVKRVAEIKPAKIQKLKNGSYIVTQPEMVSGWARIKNINQAAGDMITLTYGQQLNPDGSVLKWGGADGKDSGGFPYAHLQEDKYICKGAENESFEPKFSYKGHCYIQIDGYKGELTADDLEIYRVSNGVDIISEFSTSSEMLNNLHRVMVASVANNFQGEHCDPLIEKNGWLGDVNVSLNSMMYNFDMTGSLPGFIDVMEDGFELYGTVPIMAPNANWGVHNYPVWNTLFVFGADALEQYFGTGEYSVRQYNVMRRFAVKDINEIKSNGWVWYDNELSDWVSPMGGSDPDVGYNENPSEGSGIVATAYVYNMLDVMAKLADRLGKADDAAEYRAAMDKIYAAFNKKFYKSNKGIYETTVWNQIGTRTKYRQTSNLVPLAFGLVPQDKRDAVLNNLIKDIKDKDYHLDTGCVGTRLILPVLCDNGHSDIAYKILTQRTYPSWGYWLNREPLSTWEMWENSSRSFDHYFLGTYDEWLFSGLAGIRDIKDGYKTFTIKPNVVNDLGFVNASLDTVRGKVGSSWSMGADGMFDLKAEVPVGSLAKIVLPIDRSTDVTVNGSAAETAAGVKSVGFEDGKAVLTVGSGVYEIVSGCTERLASEIKQAKELNRADYKPTAWEPFQAAVAAAERVLADKNSAQSAIEAQKTALAQAVKTLRENVYTERRELADYAERLSAVIKQEDYPASFYNAYLKALQNAQQILADENALPDSLVNAYSELSAKASELIKYRSGNIAKGRPVTASSAEGNSGWGLTKINDGDRKNRTNDGYLGWSSSGETDKNHTEWMMIDLEIESVFDKVVIYPSTTQVGKKNSCYGFPEDFNISVSNDGKNWKEIVNETGYPVPDYAPQTFEFDAQTARYIKFTGTKLRPKPSDGNTYRIQLAEFELYNTPLPDGLTEINGRKYYYEYGQQVKNRIVKLGAELYYFGADGAMCINSRTAVDGKTYMFGADGKAVKSGFYTYGGKTYYADANCTAVINSWVTHGANEYYMGSDGQLAKNCMIGSYYVDADGVKQKNRFIEYKGESYLLDAYGRVITGEKILRVGKSRYYLKKSGALKRNAWIKYKGKTYRTDKNGALYVNRRIKVGKKMYVVDKNGAKVVGNRFYTIGKKKYFAFGKSGALKKRHWVKYKKKRYFTDKTGAVYKNKRIKIGRKKYSFGKTGICKNK